MITREVKIGNVVIGGTNPVMIQSMCAVKTYDVEKVVQQANLLYDAGAGLVRIAVDNPKDAAALPEIRRLTQTDARQVNLSVDLQENYRMAELAAPWVDKLRYNPGHLYHFEPSRPWQEKVQYIADVAQKNDCALRIGVNSGSVDPAKKDKFAPDDMLSPMLDSALEHAQFLDSIGFTRYCVSLKESDPYLTLEANRKFAAARPDVPLHLGVTEAGAPPIGIIKSRLALEKLLAEGIGATLRISLTVPADEKNLEVEAGKQLLEDVKAGRFTPENAWDPNGLNIISCPSCARVQNSRFVDLAEKIRRATAFAAQRKFTIAVMGCRVNGPGESDHADLGVWCGPECVNLKKKGQLVGRFSYDEIVDVIVNELKSEQ